jgi:hypothetical protein
VNGERESESVSKGLWQELPLEPYDYEELARRAREASPEERIAAAMAYARSRFRLPADDIEWAARMYESYLLRQHRDEQE